MADDGHRASRFLEALTTFLRTNNAPSFTPRPFDTFGLWRQIVFKLPAISAVGKRHSTDIVRAIGPVRNAQTSAGRWKHDEEARLDCAFIRTEEVNIHTGNTPWKGLRVARVHVIFKLPAHCPLVIDEPLAYVEWFTPLRQPNNVTGMHHISQSTRRKNGIDGPYAEIISISRIVRSASVVPILHGTSALTRSIFMVNPYIDKHSFCTFRLQLTGCLPL